MAASISHSDLDALIRNLTEDLEYLGVACTQAVEIQDREHVLPADVLREIRIYAEGVIGQIDQIERGEHARWQTRSSS